VTTGSGGSAGSGSGATTGSGSAIAEGSGSAQTGEGSAGLTVPERKLIKLKVVTTPSNAVVYLDGKRLGTTPNVFEVPRVDDKKGKLEIKLGGYVTSVEKIELDQGFERTITLRSKKRGNDNSGKTGSGSGKGSNGSHGGGDDLIKPDDL
jgi:hypothetical protein